MTPALFSSALATLVSAGLLVVPVQPAVPAAAPDEHRLETAASIGDGTVLLYVSATTKRRLSKAKAVAAQPCLRYEYKPDGRTQVCLEGDGLAKVRRTGEYARPSYQIPYRTERLGKRGLVFVLRQADVAPPPGRATERTWCSDCTPTERPVRVPELRMRSCAADGPWLVHGAPQPIGKAVALTFDDGPGALTTGVLRALRDARVPATFFSVGVMAQQRPDLLRRIAKHGHVLANHSWSHRLMHGRGVSEIRQMQRLVKRETGFRPCLFRAPYGENPPAVVALARSLGLVSVHWNVDPGDWRGSSADSMVTTALRQSRPGSIAVLHDGGSHRQMLAALPRYIEEMQRRHYRFVTVPELLRLDVSYLER